MTVDDSSGDSLVDRARWERLRASLADGESDDVPGVLIDLVSRYPSTRDDRLAALRTAAAVGDMTAVAAALHRLRGSSAMLGAVRLETLAAEAEDKLAAGEPASQWLPDIVQDLEQAGVATYDELRRLVGAG